MSICQLAMLNPLTDFYETWLELCAKRALPFLISCFKMFTGLDVLFVCRGNSSIIRKLL
jgi:hypothetical protein